MTRDDDGRGERSLRLFVAIELPDDVRRALASAIDAMQRAGATSGLRWVRPEGIHLTLKFLGATPPGQVPQIVNALREAVADAPPFVLQPSGFGAFHGGKKAATFRTWREIYRHNIRVIFVGLEGETEHLGALAQRVEGALGPLGFPSENRPFFGHLTLARVREDSDRPTREHIDAVLSKFQPTRTRTGEEPAEITVAFPPLPVRSISLMRSTLQRGGAVYDRVEEFPLGGG